VLLFGGRKPDVSRVRTTYEQYTSKKKTRLGTGVPGCPPGGSSSATFAASLVTGIGAGLAARAGSPLRPVPAAVIPASVLIIVIPVRPRDASFVEETGRAPPTWNGWAPASVARVRPRPGRRVGTGIGSRVRPGVRAGTRLGSRSALALRIGARGRGAPASGGGRGTAAPRRRLRAAWARTVPFG